MRRPRHDEGAAPPVWAIFGDLMSGLFGLFVLFFVFAMVFQVDLAATLEQVRAKAASEAKRREALEKALAGPLASGLITLDGGRIGIRGNVLFGVNSSVLQPEGVDILTQLAPPLAEYLKQHPAQVIMVSGFTDNTAIRGATVDNDNWALSAQRALQVRRALQNAGIAEDLLFAAAFGPTGAVAPNDTAENRAKNRRVEIAPVPRAMGRAKSPSAEAP